MDLLDLMPLAGTFTKGLDVKVDDSGEVAAVIATLNTVDHDQDVTLPGFFGTQDTRMVWSHDASEWIGKGAIREQGSQAIFEGAFFMDTMAGRERHAQVKAMGSLAEWSYGFRILAGGSQYGEFQSRPVRFLQPTKDGHGGDVFEVSPVLQGAGIRTRTLAIKSQDGQRFSEQLQETVEAVRAAAERGQSIAALRAEQGSKLGEQSMELLTSLAADLSQLQGTVAALATPEGAEPDDQQPQDPPPGDESNMEALAMHAQYELEQTLALLNSTGAAS